MKLSKRRLPKLDPIPFNEEKGSIFDCSDNLRDDSPKSVGTQATCSSQDIGCQTTGIEEMMQTIIEVPNSEY